MAARAGPAAATRDPVRRALGSLALAGAAGLTWSLVEARWYALRQVQVPVLAPGERALRVLHLSDLHLVPSHRRAVDWLRSLADLEPDLVIDTGDNIAHRDAVPTLLHAVEPLLALPGAFVLGSNDYFAPRLKNPARYLLPDARRTDRPDPPRLPTEAMVAALRAAGWVDLTNRRDALVADGRRVALVGVDDPHLDRDAFPAAAAERTPVDLRLGVAHAPYRRVLDQMHADGVHLVLAGHTHGGQLAVPGWGALVTNCDLDTRRAKGLHGWPGPRPDAPGGATSTWLHVSAGLGTSPYTPVRFACRPEATLLTLVAR